MSPHAPIINWDLRVTFKTKAQAVDAISKLLALPVDFDASFSTELTETSTVYVVEIDGMPWGDNLVAAAEIFQSVDYKET